VARTTSARPPVALIGIDVDGTLLDSRGELPDENAAAIHEAVARGIHVTLVTGRSYPFARPVANPLPDSVSLIVSNGAVERAMNGARLAQRLLDRDVARGVLEATRHHRHSAALIFDRDRDRQILFETMDWSHPGRKAYWARNQALIEQAVSLEEALTEDPIQVMFNGGVQTMRILADELRCTANGFSVSVTEYEARDFSLIDITAPGATKGQALAWRAAQMGIDRDQVMAIGDNYNDLEMLEFAGVPVVMENAVQELRTRGWEVTEHQDRAGVAVAIRRLALGR
jgi:Cof subfamily protein (haloacid dehalogenase superfamily)